MPRSQQSVFENCIECIGLTEKDLLLVLISGGGSALLPAPAPPMSLQEKQDVTRKLAAAGATIQELNTVRRALSLLKGGGLAQCANPAQVTLLHHQKKTQKTFFGQYSMMLVEHNIYSDTTFSLR